MNPEDVLKAFIVAMNAWETATWQTYQKAEEAGDISNSYWEQAQPSLRTIFDQYCTPKDRPYGRSGFSHPSDYDPVNEKIVEMTFPSSRKALVTTHKPSPTLPSTLRVTEYVMLKKAGEWRVDNKKIVYDDGTKLPYFL